MPDGSCIRPGIGPDECGAGFVHDGEYGCAPILPAETCAPGLMAVPGDSVCRPVMPCGEGTWGDIPIDATTVYVDHSYAAGDSDGSATKPWSRIDDAITAAAPGALIAIAAGSYVGDLRISGKPLRLWGVCPERVEVVGDIEGGAAMGILNLAEGTEAHGIAVRGVSHGAVITGSRDVVLDRLWVHHTGSRGIAVQANLGPSAVRVTSSLVEQCHDAGVRVSGSEGRIEATLVRETQPRSTDQRFGRGISIQLSCTDAGVCDPSARASVAVTGSLVERNHAFGVFVGGSDVRIETTVVRGTLPDASDQRFGSGVVIQLACTNGVCDASTRSSATVTQSFIEQNHNVGLMVGASDALIERTVVRGTLPQQSDLRNGRGINVQDCGATEGCTPTARAIFTLERSLVEQNHDIGVAAFGADVTIDGIVVRHTAALASDKTSGRGINAQLPCDAQLVCDPNSPSNLLLHGSLIEHNRDVGVLVNGSSGTLRRSVVRATPARENDGLFGDGVAVINGGAPASATLQSLLIEESARAGVSSFGGLASIEQVTIRCASFDIAGESYQGAGFRFEDGGGNQCGCAEAQADCVAVSAGLAPPEAIGSVQ